MDDDYDQEYVNEDDDHDGYKDYWKKGGGGASQTDMEPWMIRGED